jgi:hypothetical protein
MRLRQKLYEALMKWMPTASGMDPVQLWGPAWVVALDVAEDLDTLRDRVKFLEDAVAEPAQRSDDYERGVRDAARLADALAGFRWKDQAGASDLGAIVRVTLLPRSEP